MCGCAATMIRSVSTLWKDFRLAARSEGLLTAAKNLIIGSRKVGSIEITLNSDLSSLEKTATLLDQISKGQINAVTAALEKLSSTEAGMKEIENIHKITSVIMGKAKTTDALNVLQTLQTLTRNLSKWIK